MFDSIIREVVEEIGVFVEFFVSYNLIEYELIIYLFMDNNDIFIFFVFVD